MSRRCPGFDLLAAAAPTAGVKNHLHGSLPLAVLAAHPFLTTPLPLVFPPPLPACPPLQWGDHAAVPAAPLIRRPPRLTASRPRCAARHAWPSSSPSPPPHLETSTAAAAASAPPLAPSSPVRPRPLVRAPQRGARRPSAFGNPSLGSTSISDAHLCSLFIPAVHTLLAVDPPSSSAL